MHLGVSGRRGSLAPVTGVQARVPAHAPWQARNARDGGVRGGQASAITMCSTKSCNKVDKTGVSMVYTMLYFDILRYSLTYSSQNHVCMRNCCCCCLATTLLLPLLALPLPATTTAAAATRPSSRQRPIIIIIIIIIATTTGPCRTCSTGGSCIKSFRGCRR